MNSERISGRAGRWLLPAALWGAAALVLVQSIRTGLLNVLTMAVLVAYVGVVILRWPMVGLVLVLVSLAGQRENVYYLGFLPHYTLPVIGRINAWDVFLLFTFVAGVRRWIQREEKPLFWRALLILFLCALASNLPGLLVGDVTWRSMVRGFRNYLLGYTIYLAAVGIVDTPKKLCLIVSVMVCLMVYGLAVQFRQLSGPEPDPTIVAVTNVAGRTVLYSRPSGVLYFLLPLGFLALGALAEGRCVPLYALIAAGVLSAIGLSLVRQTYVMVVAGTLALLLPRAVGRGRRVVFLLIGAAGALLLLRLVSPMVQSTLGDSALSTIVDRGEMILQGTQDATIGSRFNAIPHQFRLWLASPNPILGYGFFAGYKLFAFADTGFPSTLVLVGALGLLAVLNLWRDVAVRALEALRRMGPSLERGFLLGAFGVWCAFLVGYALTQPFFLYPCTEIPLAMLFIDRIYAFAARRAVPVEKERSSWVPGMAIPVAEEAS